MLCTRDPSQNKGSIQTESKGMEKIFHAKGNGKKAGVAIVMSDKIDFKTKAIRIDKGHYIILKRLIQQDDITLINMYNQHRNT